MVEKQYFPCPESIVAAKWNLWTFPRVGAIQAWTSRERLLTSRSASMVRRRWPLAVVLIVLAAGGYLGWRHLHTRPPASAAKGAGKAPVPVTIAAARTADFPVWLNGLGTVEPRDTVTVRSRVDGEVTEVAFKQGQTVDEGQVLVRIDPRLTEASSIRPSRKKLRTRRA